MPETDNSNKRRNLKGSSDLQVHAGVVVGQNQHAWLLVLDRDGCVLVEQELALGLALCSLWRSTENIQSHTNTFIHERTRGTCHE